MLWSSDSTVRGWVEVMGWEEFVSFIKWLQSNNYSDEKPENDYLGYFDVNKDGTFVTVDGTLDKEQWERWRKESEG